LPPLQVFERAVDPPLEGLAPLLQTVFDRGGIASIAAVQTLVVGRESGSVLGMRCAIAMARTLSLLHPDLTVVTFDRLCLATAILLSSGRPGPFRVIVARGSGRVMAGGSDPDQNLLTPAPVAISAPELHLPGSTVIALGNPLRYRPAPDPQWEFLTELPFEILAPRDPKIAACLGPVDATSDSTVLSFQPWIGERHR